MRLEDIGFYTLSDRRARTATHETPLWRCELLLTDRCNFKCPYCRGLRSDCSGDVPLGIAEKALRIWIADGLRNVRFSGGEPTLYEGLTELVALCRTNRVERVAVSTNGSASRKLYGKLITAGVNDFSVSLDGGCCSVNDKMTGCPGTWEQISNSIRWLSARVYTTVGMVFTEQNINQCVEAVEYADSLGVHDIRVIPSAQYNRALTDLSGLPENTLTKYPILRYRIHRTISGNHVRGINGNDSRRCRLALDDMAIAGRWHFPCIIYLREGGEPIGEISERMRDERRDWIETHDTHEDPICKRACLDVCVAYNNTAEAK